MKTKAKFLVYGMMALALLITSCSSDGETGPAGSNGTNGTDGADGVANVYFSDKFFPDWNEVDEVRSKRMKITNPNFSKVSQGGVAVFVYWSTNNGTTYVLPYTQYNNDGTVRSTKSYLLRGGDQLFLDIKKFGADFLPNETEGKIGTAIHNQIRYIIVPSGTLMGRSQGSESNLDYSNFEEVKKYYNISE
ncbi:hypothetical protein ACFSX9_08360 [Flavobacterium ardleyense]|uniref:Lipoprotein n=1 Tax=Flavobacterium ardleyense TaxID=2038737 RepID=A0ABW5Z798_9FLAO